MLQQQRCSCRARIYYFRQHVARPKKKIKRRRSQQTKNKKELTGRCCSIESYALAAQQQSNRYACVTPASTLPLLRPTLRVAAEEERGETQRNAFTVGCFTLIWSTLYLLLLLFLLLFLFLLLLSAQFRLLKFAALLSFFLVFSLLFLLFRFTLDELCQTNAARAKRE